MIRPLAIVALLAGAAAAEPVAVTSDDSSITITIPGGHDPGRVTPKGDRIELTLGHDLAPRRIAPEDATFRRVTLTRDRLVIRVGHSQDTTAILAAAAQLETTPDGLVLRIPRDRKAAAAFAEKPEPPPAPEPPAPEPHVVTLPMPMPVPAPRPAEPLRLAPPPSPAPALGLRGLAIGALLLVCAVLALLARRRRAAAPRSKDAIEILATRPLGGKTRAVLVAVNNEKLLVAVHDRGTQLLGQWPENEFDEAEDTRQEPSPFAVAATRDTQESKPVEDPPTRPEISAAVAGLIRLARAGRGEGKPS